MHVVPSDGGSPARLRVKGRVRRVESILETWRIDDEWWREPISREYFSILVEGGGHLTVYRDLVEGRWYLQPD
ncbi:MAG: hypothetical protein R3195_19680 [Gemmatimonadota bacterium]|nr:hypothetical protein [Gemmatimonadota bacterium]